MSKRTTRDAHLRLLLTDRRRELQEDVQRHLRDVRTDRSHDVGDEFDRSIATISEDVAFALLQLKVDTVTRIDEALSRLDAGNYGHCHACGVEIAATRLRALPFAIRCTSCEDARELSRARQQRVARQDAGLALFAQASGLSR